MASAFFNKWKALFFFPLIATLSPLCIFYPKKTGVLISAPDI
jgi:hypothetical protein